MVQDVSVISCNFWFGVPSAWQKLLKLVSGFPGGWFVLQRGSSAVISVLEMRFWSVFP